MDDFKELSVLDYARSKRIALDHLKLNPSHLLGQIRDSELACIASTTDFEPILSSPEPLRARNKKLEIDRDGAKFLSSVLKDVSSLQANTRSIPEQIDSFVSPKYNPSHDLKVDVPLITFEEEQEMETLGKRPDPMAILNKIVLDLTNREEAGLEEGLEFPDYFWELSSMFDRDPNIEKLDASRDTACILQLALGYLDETRHREEIEKRYCNENLAAMLFRQRPTSPLYIEPEGQDENHSNDDNACMNWSPHTERVLGSQKDSLTSCETLGNEIIGTDVPPNTTRYCPSPKQLGRVEEYMAGESLKEKTSQLVEHDIRNNPSSSPSIIKNARIYTEQASKRANQPPLTADFPASLSGTLGTLSAFMQTRRQRIKRRRLGNESRYFSSPTKNSNELDTVDRSSMFKQSEEPDKLPSPPRLIHDLQNPFLYPRSMESTATPLTLILSTYLLRTESALVRSLENLPGPQSVRLIFRDFTYSYPSKEGMSNQSQVAEEADFIVSPTAGIILSSSHETTQKYLPGQGFPGIDSPLKARIVRAALRYEMLYVLIRSPTKMGTTTLSSIRELTSFCILLDQLCTIKVLLTSADHAREWILSIAGKQLLISQHTLPHLEGDTVASSYLDDQTQWEVFLQNAGLNPFAAQHVLCTLKIGEELNGLLKFVEMPSAMRREMFQEIIGDRVLSRVEKALEMDWQVDWAIGLT